MVFKKRLFAAYLVAGALLIFLLYGLNNYYAFHHYYGLEAAGSPDMSIGVTPPDPFPKGKPDFRKKESRNEK
ncbi:uncharacterized protein SAPINGB_P002509 [Magnusiomyces paraingens]|uniref:Uncharacterized protein n=1 Tax=Magnusiomyces paraingens TaxID=2606893 RepID=A0A5E8BEJ4_9ASCO|nr:uncharacterized protein SAPINGB_P002509 [Saprochaete ingens]VVT49919.1 unnamed protein product [Saprochaete ingens]